MVLAGLVWAVECGPVNIDRRVSGQPRGIVIFDCDRVWLSILGEVDLVSPGRIVTWRCRGRSPHETSRLSHCALQRMVVLLTI